MTVSWTQADLDRVDASEELTIATRRPDGTLRKAVPIWVVSSGGEVFVRTWQRRDTGWFGRAVAARRAWIGLPGLAAEVGVEDVGDDGGVEQRAGVDAAYLGKYRRFGASADRMVSDDAAASTLRLVPVDHAP